MPATNLAESAILAEQALLIDPCRDEPDQHIRFFIDSQFPLGIVYPAGETDIPLPILPVATENFHEIENAARLAGVSVRGAVSIQVYGLNRLSLVQERTRILQRLEFLGSLVIELSSIADSLEELNVPASQADIRDHAVKRTRAASARTQAEIRALADAKLPYSAMVKAWIMAWTADLEAPMNARANPQPNG